MPPKKNLLGQRFDRLTVIAEQPSKNNKVYWLCKCDCGKETIVTASTLRTRKTRSCGCKRKDNEYLKKRRMSSVKRLFNIYKRNAIARKYLFLLSLDKFCELTTEECHYCGEKPKNVLRHHGNVLFYNGIDRLVNSIGYVDGNVVSCCGTCNRLKMGMDYKEFMEKIRKIARHEKRLTQRPPDVGDSHRQQTFISLVVDTLATGKAYPAPRG